MDAFTATDFARYKDVLAPSFIAYLMHEIDAVQLGTYQPDVIHGLLQTGRYARALNRTVKHQRARLNQTGGPANANPSPSADVVERQVEARMVRKAIFGRDGGTLRFILGEPALMRPPAPGREGEEILQEQLAELAELDRKHDRVTVRILPLRSVMWHGTRAAFTLLKLAQPCLYQYLLYQEAEHGSALSTAPHEVHTHLSTLDALSAASVDIHEYLRSVANHG